MFFNDFYMLYIFKFNSNMSAVVNNVRFLFPVHFYSRTGQNNQANLKVTAPVELNIKIRSADCRTFRMKSRHIHQLCFRATIYIR